MNSTNYIQLSGRLTADVTPNKDKTFARFTIAKNFVGNEKKTLFLGCVIFKKEFDDNDQTVPWDLLKKGQEILITGRIAPNVWTDKNGTTRTDMEIVVNKIRDAAE